MIVGIPILDVPLPVIAGLLLGSAGQFEILESTRRILRKLDFVTKREQAIGIRSKYKKKYMHALLKSLRCNKAINRFSMLSKHISRICVPEKLLFSKSFPPSINPEIPVDVEKVLKFCNVKREVKFAEAVPFCINLVRDRFPEILMKAWWDYKNSSDRLKDPAEHPQPDQYPEQQLFLTIESSYCGEPLTRNILQNAWLGVSIMSQIVSTLAVAEAAYNFEHRDLHLENILVQNTKAVSLKYTIHNKHFSVQTIGYQIFIIDFTLSRIYNGKNF
ncbi:hypothetical protein TNIN_215551 [Trichonephila inaurata madagascariensis]|uniref:Protein kinase domain-containing protein n=1 Tax=Trichonephila inaurata madagascariensis TaxID=2747483 RepID=A0A8X6YI17_9ARAC|nr:hypothetical protein TNIN_215551 [Trichonephila inaurata madagascariensis]